MAARALMKIRCRDDHEYYERSQQLLQPALNARAALDSTPKPRLRTPEEFIKAQREWHEQAFGKPYYGPLLLGIGDIQKRDAEIAELVQVTLRPFGIHMHEGEAYYRASDVGAARNQIIAALEGK